MVLLLFINCLQLTIQGRTRRYDRNRTMIARRFARDFLLLRHNKDQT